MFATQFFWFCFQPNSRDNEWVPLTNANGRGEYEIIARARDINSDSSGARARNDEEENEILWNDIRAILTEEAIVFQNHLINGTVRARDMIEEISDEESMIVGVSITFVFTFNEYI